MKLPSEETLWKTASIGLGLIIGVAIISIMYQVNYMFYPVEEVSDGANPDLETYFSNPALILGKFIALSTGTFFAAAIAKLVKPELTYWSAIITGSVLMILGLFDIVASSYPVYFTIVAPLLYLPAALFGYMFINNLQQKRV
ncbi:MAG: hypothetical protein EA391_03295 [Balneolaceae bacterium]|nr:MAG: hypothetical protein EA391_03295 [Balneolaceae bacterium]